MATTMQTVVTWVGDDACGFYARYERVIWELEGQWYWRFGMPKHGVPESVHGPFASEAEALALPPERPKG